MAGPMKSSCRVLTIACIAQCILSDMRTVIIITAMLVAAPAHTQVQAQPRGKPLGTWVVEYERTVARMHAEPQKFTERGRMTLRAVGDSILGDFSIGDSTSTDLSVVRGTARKDGYSLYLEEPASKGMGVFFSALGAAMDWLRATVHGVEPVVIRFDLTAKGDSLNGERMVSGGMSRSSTSPVRGARATP